jgi:hypothetical protein
VRGLYPRTANKLDQCMISDSITRLLTPPVLSIVLVTQVLVFYVVGLRSESERGIQNWARLELQLYIQT